MKFGQGWSQLATLTHWSTQKNIRSDKTISTRKRVILGSNTTVWQMYHLAKRATTMKSKRIMAKKAPFHSNNRHNTTKVLSIKAWPRGQMAPSYKHRDRIKYSRPPRQTLNCQRLPSTRTITKTSPLENQGSDGVACFLWTYTCQKFLPWARVRVK